MATTQKNVRSDSVTRQLSELAKRVAAIERQLARPSESVLSPTTSAGSATIDVRAHALPGRQADEARLNAIAEFDAEEEREFWRPYQARIEAKKRERLIRLNEFLATRGMEPEPLD